MSHCWIGSRAQLRNNYNNAFSKSASSTYEQRKPNGKLRLSVDLRKNNNLIADDYTINNHPVSILSDAAQQLAGKSLFCKLDCSQAYHCLQMADQLSVEMLAFFLPAELLATRDSHKATADLSLLFRVSCVSTWTQLSRLTNVLNTWTILELRPTLQRTLSGTFGQSSKAFAKLDWTDIRNCHFGVTRVEFLGRTISPEGISPQARKIQTFPDIVRFPKKSLTALPGIQIYCKK